MPYELTQMRIHLQRFIQQIGDSLTSPEDIARYEDFSNKLKKLSTLTNSYYRSRLPLFPELRNNLMSAYNDALEAAVLVANERGETGPAGLRLKTVAREMIPLMQMDVQAPAPAPEQAQPNGPGL